MELESVNLSLLVAFVHLFEELNVTRAARRQGVTQSAMSYNLRKLREVFGDPLFVREGRGMCPTPRAEALVGKLRRGIEEIQSAMAQPDFDPTTSQRSLKVTSTDYFTCVALPHLTKTLETSAPRVRLEISPYSAEALRALEEGAGGLLGGSQFHGSSTDLRRRLVYRDPLVCIEAKGSTRQTLTLERYLERRHLEVVGPYPGFASSVLRERGLARDVVVATPSYAGVLATIIQTGLIGTVPLAVVLSSPLGEEVEVHEPPISLPHIEAALYWHPRHIEDAALAWLRRSILQTGQHFSELARQRYGSLLDRLGRGLLTVDPR
ncbi:MAG: LysR family transcriptional regulator [Myxococcota bacterium]